MSAALAVTGDTFETEVIKSEMPVLVDFWATWCPPCRLIAPTVDAVAQDFAGKAKVLKVDTDAEQELSEKYNITSIPTLLFFKDGKVAETLMGGNVAKKTIADTLERLIGS